MSPVDEYFIPENACVDRRQQSLSDSGCYKLVITPYRTKEGSWQYTRGEVFRSDSDVPIATVDRNYSLFVHSFVEQHPNGHQYLICGANYQGQTVIELDTGRRRDFLPEEAKEGHGFCWADHQFDPESQILVVDGCLWACPYEYRFFDFSDPMGQGWPELRFDDGAAYVDGKWPEIRDGLIRCFESEPQLDDEEERSADQRGTACIRTFRRHGQELRFVSMWLSQPEQERRGKRAAGQREYQQWELDFKSTDPLYLEYSKLVQDAALSPESYEGRGITFEGWCPGFTEKETRWCRRLVTKPEGFAVELEWAIKTGPIKVDVWQNGKLGEPCFFAHSVEGMKAAFTYARQLVSPTPSMFKRVLFALGGQS